MMMGDLVLLQEGVKPVMSALLDNGIDVTALHNHFFWDDPHVYYKTCTARGSRGTSLAERGVNPYRIKLILGHKSISSTERYLHGSQKQAWAEAQRFSMEIF
jgi:hypothetical protein